MNYLLTFSLMYIFVNTDNDISHVYMSNLLNLFVKLLGIFVDILSWNIERYALIINDLFGQCMSVYRRTYLCHMSLWYTFIDMLILLNICIISHGWWSKIICELLSEAFDLYGLRWVVHTYRQTTNKQIDNLTLLWI